MRGKAWFVVLIVVSGCAKAERAAEPAAGGQAAPPPASPAPPGAVGEPAPPSADTPTAETERRPSSADERKEPPADKDALRGLETLAQAEAALKQAETDLDALVGKQGRAAGAATPLAAGDPRCPNACKAFESLRRAADAVCRLAGDGTERCTKARAIVKASEGRLSACKCELSKD